MINNKLFLSEQIKQIDGLTIENEPISSIDLMERAAVNLLGTLAKRFDIYKKSFTVICGIGNNGGDGLALARLLSDVKVGVKVLFCKFSSNISDDCEINFNRFVKKYPDRIEIITEDNIQKFVLSHTENDIIIDCLFGTGLSRAVKGCFGDIINMVNNSGRYIISVDIPSGLFGEDNKENQGSIVNADLTLTLQFSPISSMFDENHKYFGEVVVVPIGLDNKSIENMPSNYLCSDINYAKSLIKKRNLFDHKGTYGHALIIAGSYGKAGAAVLSARACIKSGVGLLTVHVPVKLNDILQISVPEAMLSIDDDNNFFSSNSISANYSAVGIGPGLGTDKITCSGVIDFIKSNKLPLVVDADALNILSQRKNFYKLLKPGNILTPHPKEFERLFGVFENSWRRIDFMSNFSKETGIILVLKGGITTISLQDGRVLFNLGLNPGMATGGSGDVLTGIITSFLAQGYKPSDAAILGVYVHSIAGKYGKEKLGYNYLSAIDIIDNLYKAFIEIE